MSEWRAPTDAEVEDARERYPNYGEDRLVRLARAEAWQRDRGLMPPVGPKSRGDGRLRDKDDRPTRERGARVSTFEVTTALRGDSFRNSSVKPPDGVTYGAGKPPAKKDS